MDVICVGEAIVDFISLEPGRSLPEVRRFERHLGGAPANVAVGLHHHGVAVRLWSKVGTDSLGRFVLAALRRHGMAADGVAVDPRRPTRFALVALDAAGEGTLEIHNRRSADQHLLPGDVDADALGPRTILHVGGTTLLGEVVAGTTLDLLARARAAGTLVSLDPNVRLDRMPDAPRVRRRFHEALPYVDLLKMDAAAWDSFWSPATPTALLEGAGPSLLVLTRGPRGAHLRTRRHDVHVPAPAATPVDATGAGDAFHAALLARLARDLDGRPLDAATVDELVHWGRFATDQAQRVLTHRGAVTAYET